MIHVKRTSTAKVDVFGVGLGSVIVVVDWSGVGGAKAVVRSGVTRVVAATTVVAGSGPAD